MPEIVSQQAVESTDGDQGTPGTPSWNPLNNPMMRALIVGTMITVGTAGTAESQPQGNTAANKEKKDALSPEKTVALWGTLRHSRHPERDKAEKELRNGFNYETMIALMLQPATDCAEQNRRKENILKDLSPPFIGKRFPLSEAAKKQWFWLQTDKEKAEFHYNGKSYSQIDQEYRAEARDNGATTGPEKDWEDYNRALRKLERQKYEELLRAAAHWTNDDEKKADERAQKNPKASRMTINLAIVEEKLKPIPGEVHKFIKKFNDSSLDYRKKEKERPLYPWDDPNGGPPPPGVPPFGLHRGNPRNAPAMPMRQKVRPLQREHPISIECAVHGSRAALQKQMQKYG
ncbi:MAG: hypothetical protein HOO67_04965 [Candidatus Peribacteraceae bacterium]|nr:hypothetical protein [Candidatus Peribacteraceae bacterium]